MTDSPEQVVLRWADERGSPPERPSMSSRRGRGPGRRARRTPSRAPIRRRRHLVRHGDHRRRQRAARRGPPPRRSTSGASPAHPIATSTALAPRAAQGVGDHDGADAERARGARAADASGSRGQQHERVRGAGVRGSTPAFAHTKPWRVRQISRPRSARSSSADSSRTTCTCRGSLPCSAASARARAPARRRRAPARGPRPSRPPCARSRARRPARAASNRAGGGSSAARSSPGADLREAGERVEGDRAVTRACRKPLEQRARARRAGLRRAGAPSAAPRGRRACRRRARATAAARRARAPRRRSRARHGGRTSPGRRPAPSPSAASSSSAFVPEPWRSGTITTPAPPAGEQRVDLGRVERRAVPGNEQDPLGAPLARRPRCRARQPRTAPPRRGRARRSIPPRRASARRLGGHHDHAVELRAPRPERRARPETIASAKLRAVVPTASPRRCLARPKT